MIDLQSLSKIEIPPINVQNVTPPSWVDENAEISENLQRAVVMMSRYEAGISQMEAVSKQSVKSFKKTSEFKVEDNADRYAKKLCRLIKTIKFLTNITGYVTKWLEDLNNTVGWIVSKIMQKVLDIESSIVQYLMSYVEILMLKIRAFILFIKIKIAKFIKKLLEGIKDKKGSWASTALAAAIQGVLTAFKALSQAAYYVLLGIDMLLKALPPIIMVGEQNMAFFYTPRTIMLGMMKTDIIPANVNLSIMDRLPAALCLSLAALFDVVPKSNAVLKYSIIAAGAAAGLAAVYADEFKFPKSVCKAMELADPKKIIKKIDTILKAFAAPYALPKYEELSPATLGYLAFLMTGFCPAGHITFGFPGCP